MVAVSIGSNQLSTVCRLSTRRPLAPARRPFDETVPVRAKRPFKDRTVLVLRRAAVGRGPSLQSVNQVVVEIVQHKVAHLESLRSRNYS